MSVKKLSFLFRLLVFLNVLFYIPTLLANNFVIQQSSSAECYKNSGRTYAQKKWCRNGNRQRCEGSKNPYISTRYCYRYVKLILEDCGALPGYIPGAKAKDAGSSLLKFGFEKVKTLNPDKAPSGSIIVYDNFCERGHTAGHIEIKVSDQEYISDYISSRPRSRITACRKVSGIYLR